jgi:hypothetical protein
MADLTSIISISGNVGGKRIAFSHTFTLEDVDDAGAYHGGALGVGGAYDDGSGAAEDVNFFNGRLCYVLGQNISTLTQANLTLYDDGGPITIGLNLFPGQFAVLPTIASGMFTASQTGTTSVMEPCNAAQVVPNAFVGNLEPIAVVFAASQATT